MTPTATLDRPDAPDSNGIRLHRTTDVPPLADAVPTREEVFRAIHDLEIWRSEAAVIYNLFQEVTERLRIQLDSSSTVEQILHTLEKASGGGSNFLVYTVLSPNDPRHRALELIMKDNVLSEDSTEAHRLLERHFLSGFEGKFRFGHSFVEQCRAGITRH